MGKNVE
jgi:hypothetical protein